MYMHSCSLCVFPCFAGASGAALPGGSLQVLGQGLQLQQPRGRVCACLSARRRASPAVRTVGVRHQPPGAPPINPAAGWRFLPTHACSHALLLPAAAPLQWRCVLLSTSVVLCVSRLLIVTSCCVDQLLRVVVLLLSSVGPVGRAATPRLVPCMRGARGAPFIRCLESNLPTSQPSPGKLQKCESN